MKKKHDKDQTLVIQNAVEKDDETIGNKVQTLANQKPVTTGGSIGQKSGKTVQIWQPKDTSNSIADAQDKGQQILSTSQPNTLNHSNGFTVGIPENSSSAIPFMEVNDQVALDIVIQHAVKIETTTYAEHAITLDSEKNNLDNEEDGASGILRIGIAMGNQWTRFPILTI
ncbi:hypothetical protein ACH5RR_040802 [Cinchona calisaya]|uniref:Uncharacterized protein n=1 Tax=Cinchona calisaya TaxID=153742 RepID=A0ABD2XX34_9GENT